MLHSRNTFYVPMQIREGNCSAFPMTGQGARKQREEKNSADACWEQLWDRVHGQRRYPRIGRIIKLPCRVVDTFPLMLNTSHLKSSVGFQFIYFFFFLTQIICPSVRMQAPVPEVSLGTGHRDEGEDFQAESGQSSAGTVALIVPETLFCLQVK